MMANLSYQNPVWPGYFADPFVFRVGNEYYAYGTGPADAEGKEFPILRSVDLVHWESLGGALIRLAHSNANNYWAPEAIERDGRFLLYYSASTSRSDEDQRLRLAIADSPRGPYRDSGKLLLPETGFSIDANPFVDPRDNKAYLFFGMDFESDEPYGTGISVVRLSDDMTEAVGEIKSIIRASAPWQVYERQRQYKGRLWAEWNCVEGPFVIFHDGRYYCFYSGGAWYGSEYGVGFAEADHPMGPWRNGGVKGPSVLRAIAGKVIAPGHCSVVAGPNSRRLYMVYHAWDAEHTSRRMCIDPIEWTDAGPRIAGPSTEPRPLI
ncbi:MAG TPA: glycoside hydrolase family 43 protein [Tepidisphaeraceae bacterium]|nr:glycoside hydrolase family 43 protein [Tepidisphaeraceae bacterium]